MRRTSPRAGLALPEHALGEPRLDRALRHAPIPRVVQDQLLEARALPAADEVVPGVLRAERRLRDERIADESRAQHRASRLRAEVVEPLVVPAALGEAVLGGEAEPAERVPTLGVP